MQYKSAHNPLLTDMQNFSENEKKFSTFSTMEGGTGYEKQIFSNDMKYLWKHIESNILISPGYTKFK